MKETLGGSGWNIREDVAVFGMVSTNGPGHGRMWVLRAVEIDSIIWAI